jgi:hypothetical protein
MNVFAERRTLVDSDDLALDDDRASAHDARGDFALCLRRDRRAHGGDRRHGK